MTEKRRDGASAARSPGSHRGPPPGDARREPGLLARLLAGQFGTVAFIALVLAALVGWAIFQKAQLDLGVPLELWLYLAMPLGVVAIAGALRLAYAADVAEVQRREVTEKDGRHLVAEARAAERERGATLSETQRAELSRLSNQVEEELSARDWDAAQVSVQALDQRLDDYLRGQRKSTAREYVESILVAVGIAFFLRAFVVEAFKIPSGSMIPTLQVGDHIFVNKFIYGIRIPWTDIKLGMDLRKPRRGEVVVFKYPKDPDKDFIKRIVAIEGDTIEIKQNELFVNGVAVPRTHLAATPCEYEDFDELTSRWEHRRCDAWQESLDGHTYTTIYDRGRPPQDWPAVKVPPGAVFCMGDNRDNSHDSRFWGFVPFPLLRGKAMIIWWSLGEPEGIRVHRIGQSID